MRDFFLSLKIRVKLLAAFGSILLLSVLLIFFSISSINRILSFKQMNEDVDALKLNLETLELSSKEFLYESYKRDEFQKDIRALLLMPSPADLLPVRMNFRKSAGEILLTKTAG